MNEVLQSIVEQTPGARAVILMGFDGITVDQYADPDASVEIEALAMEFSFRIAELRAAAQSLDLGDLLDLTLRAERGTLLIRCLDREYFLALFLEDPRHFGKGRWLLRTKGMSLRDQL